MAAPTAQRQPPNFPPQARPAPRSPFENLQSELNRLFAQIGLAASQTSRPVNDRRRLLNKAYSETNGRIQDVCDRIEDEINKAKFVMRREYLRFQVYEAEEKRKQDELAAQKLASTKAAEKQTAASRTPLSQDMDIMEIDDITDAVHKGGVVNVSPAAMHVPVTSSMLAVPAGISPAPEIDVDALFNEVTSTATPNATTNSQQHGGDEMDLYSGNVDGASADVSGLMPGLESYVDSTDQNATTSALQTQTSVSAMSQPAVTSSGDLTFDFGNMDFTGGATNEEPKEQNEGQNEDTGEDFENWLASFT